MWFVDGANGFKEVWLVLIVGVVSFGDIFCFCMSYTDAGKWGI